MLKRRVIPYSSFAELRKHEEEGRDYGVHFINMDCSVLIMAPHGGGIEPGTSEIAFAVAHPDYSCYNFEGLKRSGNWILHVTSNKYDEPVALSAVREAAVILTLHGCAGETPVAFMGGLDVLFKHIIAGKLAERGFHTGEHKDFLGKNPRNICNRGPSGCGAQMELTHGLRLLMFAGITREERKRPTELFFRFVAALKEAVKERVSLCSI
ncbi:MAG: poly-gamma-glutamate hydrolase family protein [Deltaproteobacteria bacterium]|nr:poly-gamma-glutamate hydrolase family protein [Deltaproteobacteria bacterium]